LKIVIIANVISLIGSLMMVGTGLIKRKRNVLIVQSAQFVVMGVSNLMLGGITGCITNALSLIRNFVTMRSRLTMPVKLVFIAIWVGMCLIVNRQGLLGWLPVISACVYTWFLDTDSDVFLKIIIILTTIEWVFYDFILMNYSAFAFDILTLIANGVGIVRIKRQ
jgi:hypothetical protein